MNQNPQKKSEWPVPNDNKKYIFLHERIENNMSKGEWGKRSFIGMIRNLKTNKKFQNMLLLGAQRARQFYDQQIYLSCLKFYNTGHLPSIVNISLFLVNITCVLPWTWESRGRWRRRRCRRRRAGSGTAQCQGRRRHRQGQGTWHRVSSLVTSLSVS